MELFVFTSEIEVKIISILIFWGIGWVYRYLTASDGAMASEPLDEVEDEVEDEEQTPSLIPAMSRKMVRKRPQTAPFPKVAAAAKPRLSESAASPMKERKGSLSSKRKLFRNILLVDALMWRKDF